MAPSATAPVPARRLTLSTTDPEEAHAHLRQTYVDHSVRLSGSIERFRFRHDIIDSGGFSSAVFHHTMRCSVRTDPLDQLLIGRMLGGRLRLTSGSDVIEPGRGDAVLFPPHVGLTVEWEAFHAGLVGLDLTLLDRVAVEVYGSAARRGVRFTGSRALSPARALHWHGLVRYVHQDVLANPAAAGSILIHGSVVRLLAATALETFPNTALSGEPEAAGTVDMSAVRRATAFIEERAQDPIGLTDIADAARLSSRALQAAFRRHLGTTPVAHLRSVRLEGAHGDLTSADPSSGVTVVEIAARWGFAHHGRFAAAYRARYGCSPRRSLER